MHACGQARTQNPCHAAVHACTHGSSCNCCFIPETPGKEGLKGTAATCPGPPATVLPTPPKPEVEGRSPDPCSAPNSLARSNRLSTFPFPLSSFFFFCWDEQEHGTWQHMLSYLQPEDLGALECDVAPVHGCSPISSVHACGMAPCCAAPRHQGHHGSAGHCMRRYSRGKGCQVATRRIHCIRIIREITPLLPSGIVVVEISIIIIAVLVLEVAEALDVGHGC